MLHCPNCGSSAQFRLSTPLYYEDGVWKQQKKCGCGCVVVLRYTEEIDKIDYPEQKKRGSVLLKEYLTNS